MFAVGAVVVYGLQGVCRIEDITEMRVGDDLRSYYILCPVNDSKSTVYVPADNERLVSQMRELLTIGDIDAIIDEVKAADALWIKNDAERKAYCSAVIKNGNRKEILQLISMMYIHKEEQLNNKKRFQISDDRYLKEAEKLINDEFSYVLGISQEEVSEYIKNKIKQ